MTEDSEVHWVVTERTRHRTITVAVMKIRKTNSVI